MKVKLVANNISWASLPVRTAAIVQKLKGIYSPKIYTDIQVDVVHTSFEVPTPFLDSELDPSWFEQMIINNQEGYDCYILLINRTRDWHSKPGTIADMLLGQYIQFGATINFYIITDEWNTTIQNDLNTYYAFEDTFEHELAHAVYHDLGCPLKTTFDQVYKYGTDNVHYFTYAAKHNWTGMYQDIFAQAKQDIPGLAPVSSTIRLTIASLIKSFTQKITMPTQTPSSTPMLSWDVPDQARQLVTKICGQQGLNPLETDIICACIEQESQFSPKAINYNRNTAGTILSTDYGLCQINDYYHIGPGKDFSTAQYVLNNPQACVEYMIKMYKAGHLDYWVSYKSGAYKKYLKLAH